MPLFGKPKTVADIVAGLTNIIEQLEGRGLAAGDERGQKEAQVVTLTAECGLLKKEEAQAGTIAANLRGLLDLDGGGEVDDFSTPSV